MSDLLSITDHTSDEFVERIAGLFRDCQYRSGRAVELQAETQKRVAMMRRHTFSGLAEIGEALLRVQERLPGEFNNWFSANEERLGFCERTADKCKAAARKVREHGLDGAFAIFQGQQAQKLAPLLSVTLRLTRPIEELSAEEGRRWLDRARPVIETARAIEARLGAS